MTLLGSDGVALWLCRGVAMWETWIGRNPPYPHPSLR